MDDEHLDKLLSPTELSGSEHERILGTVLAHVRPVRKPLWQRAPLWLGLALALAVVVALPSLRREEDTFHPRGTVGGLVVEATCLGAAGCGPEDKVIVALSNVTLGGRVEAEATTPTGRVVRYFEDEDLRVGPSTERQLLSRAIVLGFAEPGEWLLRVRIKDARGRVSAEGVAKIAVHAP